MPRSDPFGVVLLSFPTHIHGQWHQKDCVQFLGPCFKRQGIPIYLSSDWLTSLSVKVIGVPFDTPHWSSFCSLRLLERNYHPNYNNNSKTWLEFWLCWFLRPLHVSNAYWLFLFCVRGYCWFIYFVSTSILDCYFLLDLLYKSSLYIRDISYCF